MNNILEQVQQILKNPNDEEKRKIAEAYRQFYEEYNAEMIKTVNPISFLQWLQNKEKQMKKNENR